MDQRLAQLVGVATSFAYAFGQVPFIWHLDKQIFLYQNSIRWQSMKCLVSLHFLFCVYRLFGQYNTISNQNSLPLILQVVYTVSVLLGFVLHMAYALMDHQLLHVLNGFLSYYKSLQIVLFSTEDEEAQRKWQMYCKVFTLCLFVSASVSSFGTSIAILRFPVEMKVFLSTLLPLPEATYGLLPWWLTCVCRLLLQLFISACLWGCSIFGCTYITLFIYWTLFILNQSTAVLNRSLDSPTLRIRNLIYSIHVYKCLEVILVLFNGVMRDYVLVIVNNISTSIGVICLILYIGYHKLLGFILSFTIFFILNVSVVYLMTVHYKFGDINYTSKKVIGKIHRSVQREAKSENQKLLGKYVKSLYPLRVDLREFGYFKKPNSLRIVTKLFYYSLKGTMICKMIL